MIEMSSSKLISWVFLECHPVALLSMTVLLVLLVGVASLLKDRRRQLYHIPGPLPLPFLGNALLFSGPPENMMKAFSLLVKTYGPVTRAHLGFRPNAVVCTAEGMEVVLSSNKHITKGRDYKFLWPWLGSGLLTSTGSKWHSRRKLLTPAFHFKILESFLDVGVDLSSTISALFYQVMNQQCAILCNDVLAPLAGGHEFDVFPLVTHCALDIICETAMGQSLGAQQCSDSQYVRAIYEASDLVNKRQTSPWVWDDLVYSLSPGGAKMRAALKTLHGFTESVIAERKIEQSGQKEMEHEDEDTGLKRRLAFLDLLLEAGKGGTVLSDTDIREEVDTFMFEGHDTTTTSMSFTLWLLATHPEFQVKCQQELDAIFMGDQDRPATSEDLAAMKFIECCLKESLRLYQSVPIISRILGEDVQIGGHTIPAQTNIVLLCFLLHRDPKAFPEPDGFDPSRFSLEKQQARHAYSYLPFSAGPRNCIGQKFALMEEKVLLAAVLRKFTLRSSLTVEEIPLCAEIILRPKNGLRISLNARKTAN